MRSLYALQLGIAPDIGTPLEAFSQVRDALVAWVQDKYRDLWRTEVSIAFDGTRVAPLPMHEIIARQETAADADLLTIVWRHPGDADDSLLWNTSCTVARVGDRIEFGILVRIAAARFEVRPARFWVGRPRVVTHLIRTFACNVSGQPVPLAPLAPPPSDMARFVATLVDPARALPLIVVTDDNWADDPLTDPAKLQDRLLGYAQVARLTKWASFRLTDDVGRERSCFNGATRIYWPGFTRDAKPLLHPLYMPRQVAHPDFANDLFDRLSRVATLRYADGPVTREARLGVEAARAAAIAGLHQAREQADRDLETLLDDLATSQTQLDRERSLREEAELRTFELEDALATIKAERDTALDNLAQVSRSLGDRTEPATPAVPAEDREIESVADAIDVAASRFGDVIEFADTARASAVASRFATPERAYQALMAIADVARKYFAAKVAGKSMGPWEKAFEDRGFRYAAKESKSTRNEYAGDRTFTHRGEQRVVFRHLTLSGGSRENCLQVYFGPDDAAKRMVIYHCGAHLPYASQST